MLSPTGRLLVRGPDPVAHSGGKFGASRVRKGKVYGHRGVDLAVLPWKVLATPQACSIGRIGIAYGGDLRFHSIVLVSCLWEIKILYAWPMYLPNKLLKRGQVFALAEDLTVKYPKVTNHIHFQLRRIGTTKWIDPWPHLEAA